MITFTVMGFLLTVWLIGTIGLFVVYPCLDFEVDAQLFVFATLWPFCLPFVLCVRAYFIWQRARKARVFEREVRKAKVIKLNV